MAFTLNRVVPWGRSYDEYVRMFDLSESNLSLRILGCADGPASFNAELSRTHSGTVVSVDPLYAFSADDIRARIAATSSTVLEQAALSREQYVWREIESVEALGRLRHAAMDEFLADYGNGRRAGRYVAGSLPALPCADGAFDLALCSHFLFTYSSHLDLAFHLNSARELLRVAREARVFPLVDLSGNPSPHLAPLLEQMGRDSILAEVRRVPYEFQRGGNEMLVLRRG